MSLTKIDQNSATSQSCRSSLVVNLSKTSQRSSVATNRSTSSFGDYFASGSRRQLNSRFSVDFDETFNSTTNRPFPKPFANRDSSIVSKPMSAPATLSKVTFNTRSESPFDIMRLSQGRESTNKRINSAQVIEVIREPNEDRSNRRQSLEENSPEPIVELKHTSSSSSASNSGSSHSSDCDDCGTKLIRRRTVRRYHRSTISGPENQTETSANEQPKGSSAELTICVNTNSPFTAKEAKETSNLTNSHFRTRQIGSYYAHSGATKGIQSEDTASSSSHLTSSKIAKCSITTNRKSTTSHHHRHLISESSSSSSSLKTAKLAIDTRNRCSDQDTDIRMTKEPRVLTAESQLKELIEPVSSFASASQRSLFDTARNSQFTGDSRSINVKEEEESSVHHHRESFSSTTSIRDGSLRKAQVSSSSSAREASARSLSSSSNINGSISSHHSDARFEKSSASSLIVTEEDNAFKNQLPFTHHLSRPFLDSDSIFTSPNVRLLAKDVGSHFAELENFALSSGGNNFLNPATRGLSSSLSSRLFGHRRLLSGGVDVEATGDSILSSDDVSSRIGFTELRNNSHSSITNRSNEDRIQELLQKARSHTELNGSSGNLDSNYKDIETKIEPKSRQTLTSGSNSPAIDIIEREIDTKREPPAKLYQKRCKAAMSEKLEHIDKSMSDSCKKLNECTDTKEAIELLRVMIQMIEAAWSVPIFSDDLGFKLCSSLREAGGLDIILGFIHDYDEDIRLNQVLEATNTQSDKCLSETKQNQSLTESDTNNQRIQSSIQSKNSSSPNPLRLNLANLNNQNDAESTEPKGEQIKVEASPPVLNSVGHTKDSDSDILTSDLGLDSTSVESLSYVSATQTQILAEDSKESSDDRTEEVNDGLGEQKESPTDLVIDMTEKQCKEELVFLSARLLSQCLTSDNRDYIIDNGLDAVVRLACELTKPKSQPGVEQHNDLHAIVGTEILQHLYKHSEDTCSQIISLGGLQAILYGCRSSNVDILRHCASALVNLALYGGSDSQQTMIEQKAHVWLFPLAFNEDDNIQYYACLAIVVLLANQEIEADVLKSSTLDLVEPFVTSHEPRKFAESTTSHIHGQSAAWLRKLIPLLESKREEAKNLACFHFAMEAYIKREQGQTKVFKGIGAVERLRKVGSSPIAIASKLACQALRLIGEKEPHKLSQQVPLWTGEDVVEWVNQIGFDRFKGAFLESRVDGDLLLQLNERMLQTDIGIENGIIRRRFLRELSNLKRIADYSSVDKSGLSSLLSSTGNEFVQYIYPMIQLGVTRDNIHSLDCDQLLAECDISNSIHRMKLGQAIKSIQDKMAIEAATNELNSSDGVDQKTLDVFVSYRRSTGSQLASLLKVHLQLRGFSVFIDVERLEAGKFDNNLLDSIRSAKNFILVLSSNALDRCIGDTECKDWVHKEIVAALASNCNIIPVIDNFHWPEAEQLPEDMRSITIFNGIRWAHDYQDACVDKVERFIRGELTNAIGGVSGVGSAGAGVGVNQSTFQRLTGAGTGCSTPSVVATPSLIAFPPQSCTASSHRSHHEFDQTPFSFGSAPSSTCSVSSYGLQARKV